MDKKLILFVVLVAFALIIMGAMIDYVGFYNTQIVVVNENITAPNVAGGCNAVKFPPLASIQHAYNTTGRTVDLVGNTTMISTCDNGIKVLTNGTLTSTAMSFDYTTYYPTGIGGVIVSLITAVFIIVILMKLFNYI